MACCYFTTATGTVHIVPQYSAENGSRMAVGRFGRADLLFAVFDSDFSNLNPDNFFDLRLLLAVTI